MERFLPEHRRGVIVALVVICIISALGVVDLVTDRQPQSRFSFESSASSLELTESAYVSGDALPSFAAHTTALEIGASALSGQESVRGADADLVDWTRLHELEKRSEPDLARGATPIVVIDTSPLPAVNLPSDVSQCELPPDTRPLKALLYRASFDGPPSDWLKLSGEWESVDGRFEQAEAGGHDRIAQLLVDPPLHYRVAVTLAADDGLPTAGLLLGQPLPNRRHGATVVDIVEGGQSGWFLRWGRYDFVSGAYTYDGGTELGEKFEPAVAHRLAIEVRQTATVVLLDGIVRASFAPIAHGRLGLVAHDTPVTFDEFVLETLHDL